MPSTPRRAAIAVAAVLTAVTLVACSSGDGARNAVAVGGTFQFHSPGGQTEIIWCCCNLGREPRKLRFYCVINAMCLCCQAVSNTRLTITASGFG